MLAFANLYEQLDNTTSTNAKIAALKTYFADASPEDAVWALYFLTGRKLKRLIPSGRLREWAADLLAIDAWLLEDSYIAVGDLGETIALLIDSMHEKTTSPDLGLNAWVTERILPLRDMDVDAQRRCIQTWWRELPLLQTFLLNKLLTGSFRVGVSETLVVRALASIAEIPTTTMTHRLLGDWQPTAEFYQNLFNQSPTQHDDSHPYPFFLASPLEREPLELGDPSEWQAEWKWDGIRCQLVKRNNNVYLWSRGEDLITGSFPDLAASAQTIPGDFVVDGELLAMRDDRPMPFAALQKRLGRKKPGAGIIEQVPVGFMAYDLLEMNGLDLRERPLVERRHKLEDLILQLHRPFYISGCIDFPTWDDLRGKREQARGEKVEGIMLKRLDSTYQVGRKRGDWWKWKVDPYSIDAVLLYAQAGHGRRANLYTDYTFAVWDDKKTLVPIAKAYSGLSDEEIGELDRWIRTHTLERFGPVRSVTPTHVFELNFEGIAASPRHKSGIALRFPRIMRWRKDKKTDEADTLTSVRELLHAPQ